MIFAVTPLLLTHLSLSGESLLRQRAHYTAHTDAPLAGNDFFGSHALASFDSRKAASKPPDRTKDAPIPEPDPAPCAKHIMLQAHTPLAPSARNHCESAPSLAVSASNRSALRRSALGVCSSGDPWGTPLQLETRHSWAPVMATRGQTLRSPWPKATSVLTRL